MNKKKILHVTFDMGIAGTEQVIVNLVTALDPEVYENHLFCIEEPLGELGKKLRDQGFKIHSCHRQAGFDWQVVKRIKSVVREQKIDIVHCHQYSPYVYGLLAGVLSGRPVVFTEHGRLYPDLPSSKRRLINPWLCRVTKALTVISKATQDALVNVENMPRKKIQVVYNGIHDLNDDYPLDQALRSSLSIADDELVFGTISRLDPIKNQEMMLEAFAKVVQGSESESSKMEAAKQEASQKDASPITAPPIKAKLLMVGDGPIRKKLEDLAQTLGISDQVVFTGFQVQPQRYLRLMDIFLLSSLSEGTSMTLLEAMSFNKACVVTDAGGNPEIVVDRRTGLVTANEDGQAFAAAMLELAKDAALRERLGLAGRKRYLEKFSVQSMAQSYSEIYQNIS